VFGKETGLAFEAEGAATAVAGRAVKCILNIVDTGGVARVCNGLDKLTVDLAGCYFISVRIEEAHHDAIRASTGGADVNHILGAFGEYIRILDEFFSTLFNLIALQEVEACGKFGNTLVAQAFGITLSDYFQCAENENGENDKY